MPHLTKLLFLAHGKYVKSRITCLYFKISLTFDIKILYNGPKKQLGPSFIALLYVLQSLF
jgi:hypothetical protein